MPKVSVILSVYNNRNELPRAINSILRQSFQDFEMIAVNDGSVDGSGEILDDYAKLDRRVTVIHQENIGLGPSLHRACQLAKGVYLARQDADDVSAPTRLQRQVAYMEQHPEVAVCGTWAWFIDPDNTPVLTFQVPDNSDLMMRLLETTSNPFVHGSTMFRKALYDAEGTGYRFKINQDYDLWLRMSGYGHFGMVESVEYYYWLSVNSIGRRTLLTGSGMRALAIKLHHERKTMGDEISDWKVEEAAISNRSNKHTNTAEQKAAILYAQGITALLDNDISEYRARMCQAAGCDGVMATKARKHLRLQWAVAIIRFIYTLRYRNTAQQYCSHLPAETNLPPYCLTNRTLPN